MKKPRILMLMLCATVLCICGCTKTIIYEYATDNSENNGADNSGGTSDPNEDEDGPSDLEYVDDVCSKMTDSNFMEYCYENFDVDHDGKVSMTEAAAVTEIILNDSRSYHNGGMPAIDFSGIEYFWKLECLESNIAGGSLDLSKNARLSNIYLCESAIESVDLQNTNLSSLGEQAFYYCTLLTSIIFPDGLTKIGNHAFEWCYHLTSIEFPEELISIDDYAFYYCTGLASIELPTRLTSIGDYAFSVCESLASVDFPNGLTTMGDYAFYDCINLTSIKLPENLTTLSSWTFGKCTRLESVELPKGLTEIGGSAFNGCYALVSIELPEGLTSISNFAFYNCSSLVNVTAKASNPPTLGNTMVFYNIGSNPVLYVPSGREDTYASSAWGSFFSDIRAIEE